MADYIEVMEREKKTRFAEWKKIENLFRGLWFWWDLFISRVYWYPFILSGRAESIPCYKSMVTRLKIDQGQCLLILAQMKLIIVIHFESFEFVSLIWRWMLSNDEASLPPDPFWLGVVQPVRFLSMVQINMYKYYSYSIGRDAKKNHKVYIWT